MNVGEFCRALYQVRARTGTAASLTVGLGGDHFVYRLIREVGDPLKLVFIDIHMPIAEVEAVPSHLVDKFVDERVVMFNDAVALVLQHQKQEEEKKPNAYN